ncbi:MAG: hypothetical protein HY701_03425 [Gemmatimonadetes bacterium]|nr:hypothetical protein [Gemmatimonadota bacterium]
MHDPWPPPDTWPYLATEDEVAPVEDRRWGWIEIFLAIQLLWGVLLFVPGIQPFRVYVRALPYVSSLAAFAYYLAWTTGERLHTSSQWLIAVLALLSLNLLHEETHLIAGIAQAVLQLSIAAPMFWVGRTVRTEARLHRVLLIMFWASFASAAVGVLQVYYPDRFLPPEFSGLARQLNPAYVMALSYVGADGRLIIRPSGFSDLPGGAAIAGLLTVIVGVALAVYGQPSRLRRIVYLGAAGIGMTVLYLTQVRSLTILAPVAVMMFAAVRLRQGRWAEGAWVAGGSALLVAGSFAWAVALGGTSLEERFFELFETGLFTSFQENRGLFLEYTLYELLFEFPFGAGLGRWGMMHVYFSDPAMWLAPPIHVEIQITGWLLDGGVPMWICYGGALASAVWFAYRTATRGPTERIQYFATVTLAIQVMTFGLCFTGPVFNTQLGLQFWLLTAALAGTLGGVEEGQLDDLEHQDADGPPEAGEL